MTKQNTDMEKQPQQSVMMVQLKLTLTHMTPQSTLLLHQQPPIHRMNHLSHQLELLSIHKHQYLQKQNIPFEEQVLVGVV